MAIIFENPTFLWALISIPVIILAHFWALRYSKARAVKFANFVALSRVSKGIGLSSNMSILVLRIIILLFIIFAIAGTVFTYTGKGATIDYVLGVDVSSSMLQEDVVPTRIDAAKEGAELFVDVVPVGSSVGVLSFSGTSFVDSPLSDDKFNIKSIIRGLQPQTIGGTDISSAIITGTNILLISEKPRAMIVLTDGRSNIGVPEEVAIQYANRYGVSVYTIGVGAGDEFEFGIDEESLKNIAAFTGGQYFFADSSEGLKEAYATIAQSGEGTKFLDLSFILTMAALVLLLFDWVLINTLFSRIP